MLPADGGLGGPAAVEARRRGSLTADAAPPGRRASMPAIAPTAGPLLERRYRKSTRNPRAIRRQPGAVAASPNIVATMSIVKGLNMALTVKPSL